MASTVRDDDDEDDEGALLGARVAISSVPGPEFIAAMHAIWLCGGIAVPIARGASKDETAYVLRDADVAAFALVKERDPPEEVEAKEKKTETNDAPSDDTAPSPWDASEREDALDAIEASGTTPAMIIVPEVPGLKNASESDPAAFVFSEPSSHRNRNETRDEGALLIYTSGTTGQPKGVLHTHGTLAAQCHSLCAAWEWHESDAILHCLPLHHIHGLVNAWMCAHWVGARVEFARHRTGFSPRYVWSRLRRGGITVFMGVPTTYVVLLRALRFQKKRDPRAFESSRSAVQSLRLVVSGSASCPVPVMREWTNETGGAVLLERYGATEIGMALSNPLRPITDRVPGTVGKPLPGVEIAFAPLPAEGGDGGGGGEIVFSNREKKSARFDSKTGPGELLVRGPGVFREYWNRPEATRESFTEDGFFKTGDFVEMVVDGDGFGQGAYRVLGRTSVDIIKTGGFKVSALEVEAKLLEHPRVREVSVVGVPDDAYGERGVAIVVLEDPDLDSDADDMGSDVDAKEEGKRKGVAAWNESDVKKWARGKMAEYKVPVRFRVVDALPRNAMGQVNKKHLRAELDLLRSDSTDSTG
jgi:malonyl-CoA/methylmalonyl-CoA synthetase